MATAGWLPGMYGKCARSALGLNRMVSAVARTASASGRRSGLFAAGLLAIAGCTGTEHAVFLPVDLTVAPPMPMDAAVEPVDSTVPVVPDAAPEDDEDAATPPDPDLDRNVSFEWNETLPGQGTCHAGQYVGSFTCMISADGGVVSASELSGQVVFTLGTSSEQQVLSITEGAIKDSFGFNTADLTGSLRCTDRTFEAQTVGGMVWFPFSAYEATLAGAFDDQALMIEGQFTMTNQVGETCVGDFHVSAAP